jgi:hypothetical protein
MPLSARPAPRAARRVSRPGYVVASGVDPYMRPLPGLLLALAVAASAAGCLGDPGDRPPAREVGVAPVDGAARPLRLLCSGEPPSGEAAACAARLPGLDVASEPYVAVDPEDGRRMALAIQTRTAAVQGTEAAAWPVRVYASEDAGRSWRAAATPIPAARAGQAIHADPLVAFGPGGVLYVSGLVSGLGVLGLETGPDVYVARSDDLGRTWTEPALLTSDGDNDRQWMAVGPDGTVVLAWQTINGEVTMQGAWSRDGGATWTPAAADVPGCNLVSRPLVGAGGYLVACSAYADPDGCATRLYRVPFADGVPTMAGCPAPEGCGGTNMLAAAPGRLVLACLGQRLFESLDSGATWRPVGSVQDLVPEATAGRDTVLWMEADAGGGVHLLLTTLAGLETPAGPQISAAHAVLVPAEDWRLAGFGILTSEDQAYLAPQKGEFAGIGVGPGAGAVAWIHADHQVRVAQLG